MPDQSQQTPNVFNHMVAVTVAWSGTQINTLNSWNGTLQNWSNTNQTLSDAQVDDEICYYDDATGRYLLDSVAYDQWVADGKPKSGELYDTVNEQSLMVTGFSIDDYDAYVAGTVDPYKWQRTGVNDVHDAESMNAFINANFSGDTNYLDAVSSTFIVFCEGLLGKYEGGDSDSDEYSTNMNLFNQIASTVSAKANTEEQPSSNAVNTEGSIIQQTTSAMDTITGCNEQVQNVLGSLISSGMGKF